MIRMATRRQWTSQGAHTGCHVIHRLGGPAVEWDTGVKDWYCLDSPKYTQTGESMLEYVHMDGGTETHFFGIPIQSIDFPGYGSNKK